MVGVGGGNEAKIPLSEQRLGLVNPLNLRQCLFFALQNFFLDLRNHRIVFGL